ncbi:hypothetical protein PHSC3_001812 [Chlamydiales bacterium STE3]|nr:hypothetical protein PHSC3_001812 [Chlamydiales bacterium STE3]
MCISLETYNHCLDSYFQIPKKGEWRSVDVIRLATWAMGGVVVGGIAWAAGRSASGSKKLYQRIRRRNVAEQESVDEIAQAIMPSLYQAGPVEMTQLSRASLQKNEKVVELVKEAITTSEREDSSTSSCSSSQIGTESRSLRVAGNRLQLDESSIGVDASATGPLFGSASPKKNKAKLRPEMANERVQKVVFNQLYNSFGCYAEKSTALVYAKFVEFVNVLDLVNSGKATKTDKNKIFEYIPLLFCTTGIQLVAPDEYERLSQFMEFCYVGIKIKPLTPLSTESQSRFFRGILNRLVEGMVTIIVDKEESLETRIAARSLFLTFGNPLSVGLSKNVSDKKFSTILHDLENEEKKMHKLPHS